MNNKRQIDKFREACREVVGSKVGYAQVECWLAGNDQTWVIPPAYLNRESRKGGILVVANDRVADNADP